MADAAKFMKDDTLTLRHLGADPDDVSDLIAGLSRESPKVIPTRFSYSDRGSMLFEQLCCSPDYYLTRAERSLLERHGAEIADHFGDATLYDLGAGNSEKIPMLLRHAPLAASSLHYCPVDVNALILRKGAALLRIECPDLTTEPIVASHDRLLKYLSDEKGLAHARRRIVAFLGSSYGNFDDDAEKTFLTRLAAALEPGELFLLGSDLQKAKPLVELAYNDRDGILAELERTTLLNLNSLFDGNFDPSAFRHVAVYELERQRVESLLISEQHQTVDLKALRLSLEFSPGDKIINDIMKKPRLTDLVDRISSYGFNLASAWLDEERWYSLILFKRV